MYKLYKNSMYDITKLLQTSLKESNCVSFEVLNPDIFKNFYSGTKVEVANQEFIHRPFRAWVDLANRLSCRILLPKLTDEHLVVITFEKINIEDSFHKKDVDKEEKYGEDSIFSLINKNEEPEIMLTYLECLKNVNIEKRKRVLNLGVNSAEEFELIKDYVEDFSNLELVGIDYCTSAIKNAQKRFKNNKNVTFYAHDINDLDSLGLEEFDLIVSIGTLQSSNLEFNKLFMHIVQNYLKKDGAMILGFPNCRWHDGEVIYGAKPRNYNFSEMSVLYKDAVFCKKYLQQKKFRVTLTGKNYIFLTATSIRKN